MPNGVISDYTYDSLNRLTQLREYDDTNDNHVYDPGVDTLLSEYDYDLLANGNRSGVTEETLVDGVLEQTRIDWAYDSLGRLTSESYQGYDSSQSYIDRYSYDLVGNRLEEDAATAQARQRLRHLPPTARSRPTRRSRMPMTPMIGS